MSEPAPDSRSDAEPVAASGSALDEAKRRELDRRISDLAQTGDHVFGRIGSGEWALVIFVSVAIPLAVVWWFA
ncbi:MAG: hypothetical protein HYY06_04960 [Deltaproteobacteria bacterium]|nr:hypothetical protein [Deltaproteobacteria bacterium]